MQLANCSELHSTASLLPPHKTKSWYRHIATCLKTPWWWATQGQVRQDLASFALTTKQLCPGAHTTASMVQPGWGWGAAATSSEMVCRNQAAAGLRILGFMVYYAWLYFSTRHAGQIIHCAISLSSKPKEFTEAAQLLSQAEFNLLSC